MYTIPVLELMGKPGRRSLEDFIALFRRLNGRISKRQFLTYYFMAAHPGCTPEAMAQLRTYVQRELRLIPEQVQIFTPSPSTFSTLMYYTGIDPFSDRPVFVERTLRREDEAEGDDNRRTATLRQAKAEECHSTVVWIIISER